MKRVLPNLSKGKIVIFSVAGLHFLTARRRCPFTMLEAENVVYWLQSNFVLGLM